MDITIQCAVFNSRGVASLRHAGGTEHSKGTRAKGTRIETPQASRGVGSGEGVSPSPVGEGPG